ncbi:MFS transporter [Planococcus sp. YIM B11945]|uniref:MFS transporter n=1 Tax=Planococcus sp. YIM B11945 TaxID=3435410 RepID=UPI003D7D8A55
MELRTLLETWKEPGMLLLSIGTSNIGAWVYLLALNLLVLEMTHSPLAVAGLYLAKPAASLLTNLWSGSVIDRMNKRRLMIGLDVARAGVVACLPFVSSLGAIYAAVMLINMASSVFDPASFVYTTKLVPKEQRKRFNALRSLVDSGAFLIGPAVAGVLFLIGTPTAAIYINAAAFAFSGMVLVRMPNVEKKMDAQKMEVKVSFAVVMNDWKSVGRFSRKNISVMSLFFLFSCVMVLSASIDSQEASFAKAVLLLSDAEYGFLVSVAGAGIILGASVNALLVKKLRAEWLMGGGALFFSAGYAVYAFSTSFWMAATGFAVLAFAMAFANTGFQTYTQTHIPVGEMGRILSLYGFVEALLVIAATIAIGIASHLFSIQAAVIAAAFLMGVLAIVVAFKCFNPVKQNAVEIVRR